jgi:hypothetical protein
MMMHASHNKLLLELGNNTFKLNKDIILEIKSNKIENYSLEKSSKNPVIGESFEMKRINNFVNNKPETSEKIAMNLIDYARAVFKCKATYTKNQYKFLKFAVMNNLEITNIIKSNLMIEKINRALFPADDARELMISKMNVKMEINDDRDCKLLLKSLSKIISEEVTLAN